MHFWFKISFPGCLVLTNNSVVLPQKAFVQTLAWAG